MKHFAFAATSVLAFASSCVATASPDQDQDLAKRAVCNTVNWVAGLSRIEAAVDRLGMTTIGRSTPPCSFINATINLIDYSTLVSFITTEAKSISACTGSVTQCISIHGEFTSRFIPKASSLASVILALTAQIRCNRFDAVVRSWATTLRNAMTSYDSAIRTKVNAPCYATLQRDISSVISQINRVSSSVVAP